MIELPDLITTISLGLSLLVWVVVIRNKSRSIFKLLYSGISLSVILWLLTLYLYYIVEDINLLLLIGRFNFAVIGIGFISLYFFTKIFPYNTDLKIKGFDFVVLLSSVVFLLTQFSDLFIEGEIITTDGGRETVFGGLYPLYLLTIIGLVVTSIINLYRNYKNTTNYYKVQIRYFSIGLGISMLFGFTTNVFLPLIGVFTFQQFGPLAVLVLISSVGFLIVKHRFLSINVVVGKSLMILILSTATYIMFYFIIWFENTFFLGVNTKESLVLSVPLSIGFVLFFTWLYQNLQDAVSERIVNNNFEPSRVLAELNRDLSETLELEEIVDQVTAAIDKTISPAFQFLILKKSDFGISFEAFPADFTINSIKYDDIASLYIDNETDYLILEDLNTNSQNPVTNKLNQYKSRLIVKIEGKKEIIGYLILGPKEKDSPYLTNEIDFIRDVADILYLALERSILYKEVKDLNQNLQVKVNEATSELKQKYDELEEAYRQEKDMMDILGHELRTPLSTSRNAFMMLENEMKNEQLDKDKIDKYTALVKNNLQREIRLLETMLSTTDIENDKIQLNLAPIPVNDLVTEVTENYKTEAEKKGLALNLQLDQSSPNANADKDRLFEIIDNLVSNAMKYTNQGSITVTTDANDDFVSISIADTGSGIPEQDIPNLGKKFYRVDQHIDGKKDTFETFTRPGGTGLGLYVAFGLARLMGGKISVESEVGKGSKFTIWLPKPR